MPPAHPEEEIRSFLDNEQASLQAVGTAITLHACAHPQDRFHAASFWLLYVDDTLFDVPCFPMNIADNLQRNDED